MDVDTVASDLIGGILDGEKASSLRVFVDTNVISNAPGEHFAAVLVLVDA